MVQFCNGGLKPKTPRSPSLKKNTGFIRPKHVAFEMLDGQFSNGSYQEWWSKKTRCTSAFLWWWYPPWCLTASWPLKNHGWKMILSFFGGVSAIYFRGDVINFRFSTLSDLSSSNNWCSKALAVSFREGIYEWFWNILCHLLMRIRYQQNQQIQ